MLFNISHGGHKAHEENTKDTIYISAYTL